MITKKLKKNSMQERIVKGVNVVAQLALIFYFSGVAVFIVPPVANAADVTTGTEVFQGRVDVGQESQNGTTNVCGPDTTPPSLVTTTIGVPYTDNFEGYALNQIITDPWSEQYGVRVRHENGDKAAELNGEDGCGEDNEKMWITIDTTDSCGLSLEYDRKLSDFENDDYFYSEYSINGTSWNTLESKHGSSNWNHKTYNLPLETYNITGLQIRFRVDVNHDNDKAYVDNFSITGSDCTPYYIEGYKWNDLNKDGVWENEPGLPGWTIQLYQNKTPLDTEVTNSNGYYIFDDLVSGDYTVCEVLQDDWTQSYPNGCYDVTLGNNKSTTPPQYNFGNYETLNPATIHGHKVVCEAEEYLPDWGVVDGVNPDKPSIITSTTAQDWVNQSGGHCWIDDQWVFQWVYNSETSNPNDNQELYDLPWQNFTTVDPLELYEIEEGRIWLRESPNTNWVPFNSVINTQEYQESAEFYCGVDILNYDNYEWIGDEQLPLENGGEYHCVGFNAQPVEEGSLEICKYNDIDENGAFDDQIDTPLQWNFEVEALSGSHQGDTWFTGSNPDTGCVTLEGFPYGTYEVTEEQVSNWIQTYPTNPNYHTVILSSENTDPSVYFLNYFDPPTYKINGQKFHDIDANRIKAANEEWTADEPVVTIQLTGGDINKETTTDSNGYYQFSGLPAGTYEVCEVVPDGWMLTYPFGNGGCHEVTVGPQIAISTLDHYEVPTYDFGNYAYGMIEGNKWEDKNINTLWDEDETGKEGWTINLMTSCSQEFGDYDYVEPYGLVNLSDFVRFTQLYNLRDATADLSRDGLWGKPDVSCFGHVFNGHELDGKPVIVKTTQTAADGSYSFTGLEPGAYTVGEETRVDWYQSTPGTTNGLIEELVITSQVSYADQNFGNYQIPEEPEPEPEPETPVINITKADDADPVIAGNQIVYTLTWDVSEADVTDLILTDTLPVETTIVSVMDGGLYDSSTHTVSWDMGDQSAGSSGTVSYIVNVKADVLDGTVIVNTATLDSNETEAKIATENTAITNGPILSLVKTVDTTAVLSPSDEVNFTLKVENNGFGTAENVRLVDALPNELFFSDVLGTEREFTSGGSLAVGDSMEFTYPVTIKSDTATGTYTNTATLSADNYGTITAVASVKVQAEGVVLGEEALPNLVLVKSVDLPFANPGDTANYTVTATNNGEAPAINLVLTDTLPTGFTFDETGGMTRTWKIGDLAQGKSKSVTYAVLIGSSVTADTYDNVAVVTADNHDPVTAKVGLEVRSGSVLGDETTAELEDTGASLIDYLIMIMAALILFGAAGTSLWIRQRSKTRA